VGGGNHERFRERQLGLTAYAYSFIPPSNAVAN
jgi:hypothetical protein